MLCHLCASGEDILYTCHDERMAVAQEVSFFSFFCFVLFCGRVRDAPCQRRCSPCPRSLTFYFDFFYCPSLHSLPIGTTEIQRAEANKREPSTFLFRCFMFTWKRFAVAKLFTHFFACVFRGAMLLILSWFLLISVVYGFVKLTGEEKEWSLQHKVCSGSDREQKRLKTCSQYAELLLIQFIYLKETSATHVLIQEMMRVSAVVSAHRSSQLLFHLTHSRHGAVCSPIRAEQVEWFLSRAFTIFCVIEVITGSSCCMSSTGP